MKTKIVFSSLVLIMALAIISYKVPEGWIKACSKPDYYDMGIDPGAGHNGKNAATIASTRREIEGFGTLMQNIDPENYKGKRIRLSGMIKAEDVQNWAGLWLRVDGKVSSKSVTTTLKNNNRKVTSDVHNSETKKTLAFDNMYNRAIKGTMNWTKCEIVLDVADTATNIAFGALLNGTGQIWFDDLKLDIVDKDIPLTSPINKEPVNLDFEK